MVAEPRGIAAMIVHGPSDHLLIGRQSWKGSIATLTIHAALVAAIVIWSSDAGNERSTTSAAPRTTLMVDLAPIAAPVDARRARPAPLAETKAPTPEARERTESRDTVSPVVEALPPLTSLTAVPLELPSIEAAPSQLPGAAVPMASAAAIAAPPAATSTPASDGTLQPAVGAASTVSNWPGLVLGRLQHVKRYPANARARRLQGVSMIRFTLDRRGRVLSVHLERSSGHDVLDHESVALIRRAEPFPLPPPGVPGDAIELVVPVEFFLTR